MDIAEFLNDLECELAKERVEAERKHSRQYTTYHLGEATALEYVFFLAKHWGLYEYKKELSNG